ncbi:C6orf125 [Trichuris trichiura]|uniref:Mitochondrial nucleoid factor 1 n=1 Tax=Trichuris trichiura TaxID=36087 RepID=A0A077Z278_TRITR|nr:C6orf125 [Trichuris trichiura]
MTLSRYRLFLNLCKRWPVDDLKSKSGRDLGSRIREEVVSRFDQAENTIITDEAACDRIYEALQDLVNDKHRHDFALHIETGVMGRTLDECRLLTSDKSYSTLDRHFTFTGRLKAKLIEWGILS